MYLDRSRKTKVRRSYRSFNSREMFTHNYMLSLPALDLSQRSTQLDVGGVVALGDVRVESFPATAAPALSITLVTMVVAVTVTGVRVERLDRAVGWRVASRGWSSYLYQTLL